MTHDTPLAPDRLARRREHLMTEIAATQDIAAAPAVRNPRGTFWQPRRLLAAAASVAVIAGAAFTAMALTGGPTGAGATAFAVARLPHGKVSIRVVSTAASAKQMTDQLHAKGLDIFVTTVPATPQLVGTWVSMSTSQDFSPALAKDLVSQALSHSVTLDVPAHFTGSLGLSLAVAPSSGEQPEVAGLRNALAPGAPLACSGLSGTGPDHAAAVLERRGYTVLGFTTGVGLPGSTTPDLTKPPRGTKVTAVFIEDMSPTDSTQVLTSRDHDVAIQIASPADASYPILLHAGFAPSQSLTGC
jgi:hypothetical protein